MPIGVMDGCGNTGNGSEIIEVGIVSKIAGSWTRAGCVEFFYRKPQAVKGLVNDVSASPTVTEL